MPMNELHPLWLLEHLMNLEKLEELKAIKHNNYLWKKCFERNNNCIVEWNVIAREELVRS